jgi:uncharacterized membrane protein
MKVKVLVGVLVFLIALNLGTIGSYVYFQLTGNNQRPGFSKLEEFPEPLPPRMELHLNRQQRHQLMSVLRNFNEESRPARIQIRELEGEVLGYMQEDPVPLEKVEQNLKKMSDLRLEVTQMAVRKMIDAKQFLTPQQQRRFFISIMRERPERPEGRRIFRSPRSSDTTDPGIFMKKKGELP